MQDNVERSHVNYQVKYALSIKIRANFHTMSNNTLEMTPRMDIIERVYYTQSCMENPKDEMKKIRDDLKTLTNAIAEVREMASDAKDSVVNLDDTLINLPWLVPDADFVQERSDEDDVDDEDEVTGDTNKRSRDDDEDEVVFVKEIKKSRNE